MRLACRIGIRSVACDHIVMYVYIVPHTLPETREIGTMPETGVATVPTAALVSLMVLAMGSYVVLKKKESC